MTEQQQLCVICGERPATGRDHLPPSIAFPKPRPSRPILVPACDQCNSGSAVQDQEFAAYLSLHVGLGSPRREQLWRRHIRPTLQSNTALSRKILSSGKKVLLSTPSGLVYGTAQTIQTDGGAHDAVIERVIRGFYYYHFQEILGKRVGCQVQFLPRLTKEIGELLKVLTRHSIGGTDLVYWCGRAVDEPVLSLWVFLFYGVHWCSGFTGPDVHHNDALQRVAGASTAGDVGDVDDGACHR